MNTITNNNEEELSTFLEDELSNMLRLMESLSRNKVQEEEKSNNNPIMLKTLLVIDKIIEQNNSTSPQPDKTKHESFKWNIQKKELQKLNINLTKPLIGFCGNYQAGKTTIIKKMFNLEYSHKSDYITLIDNANINNVIMDLSGFNKPIQRLYQDESQNESQNEQSNLQNIKYKDKVLKRFVSRCDIIVYVVNSLTLNYHKEISKMIEDNQEMKNKPIFIIHNNLSIVSENTLERYTKIIKANDSQDTDLHDLKDNILGNVNVNFKTNEVNLQKILKKIHENTKQNKISIEELFENNIPYNDKCYANYNEYYSAIQIPYGFSINKEKNSKLVISLEMINVDQVDQILDNCKEKKDHYTFIISTKKKKTKETDEYLFSTQTNGNYLIKIKIGKTKFSEFKLKDCKSSETTYTKGVVTISYELDKN